ncbi:hypothetical protein DUNSADRAFT_7752 [Dunaliella salina]|uniref:Uncharacterized protein n=1 Tax=Dunaliella salina TaxID=3046 RepID=A0ABQ7GKS4_DUNSA|nr:hypothetical protein DUNSADRAFT_7752 [Dunaliella salina]|eukprot:KAF5835210.1 hypothetical protein DUNSADRAFT_7752 [Dunaliella salina]
MVIKAEKEDQKDLVQKSKSTSSRRGTPERATRTPGGRPRELSRLSSSSYVSTGSKTSSRHPNSGRRLQPQLVGATSREVLFDHYIKMAQQQTRAPQGYEKPGALARLFLLLCLPTDLLDFRAFVKLTQWVVVTLARAVVLLSFLLVPLWLLLLWVLAVGGSWQDIFAGVHDWRALVDAGRSWMSAVHAGGVDWQKLAYMGGGKLAGSLPELQSPEQVNLDPSARWVVVLSRPSLKPSPAPHGLAAPHANNITANSHTQGPAPSAANSDGKTATGAQKRVDNPLVREVRSAVIKLEHQVLGNEITGAVLPQEVLPARVSTLCEQVGLPCSEHPSMEEMAQLVKNVAEQVGVEL